MKKKTSQIIFYAILGVIVCALIFSAVFKKNFAPNVAVPLFADKGIGVESVTETNVYTNLENEDDYKAFVSNYNAAFELTILYALFSGKLTETQSIAPVSAVETFTEGYVVSISYMTEQILKVNGKEYSEGNSSTKVNYTNLVFNVKQDKGLVNTSFYITSTKGSVYKLTTLANFDKLYKVLSENILKV